MILRHLGGVWTKTHGVIFSLLQLEEEVARWLLYLLEHPLPAVGMEDGRNWEEASAAGVVVPKLVFKSPDVNSLVS
jgi:hypothetical protein